MAKANSGGVSVQSPEDRARSRAHNYPDDYRLREPSARAMELIRNPGSLTPAQVAAQLEEIGEPLPAHYPHHPSTSRWHADAVTYALRDQQEPTEETTR